MKARLAHMAGRWQKFGEKDVLALRKNYFRFPKTVIRIEWSQVRDLFDGVRQ